MDITLYLVSEDENSAPQDRLIFDNLKAAEDYSLDNGGDLPVWAVTARIDFTTATRLVQELDEARVTIQMGGFSDAPDLTDVDPATRDPYAYPVGYDQP